MTFARVINVSAIGGLKETKKQTNSVKSNKASLHWPNFSAQRSSGYFARLEGGGQFLDAHDCQICTDPLPPCRNNDGSLSAFFSKSKWAAILGLTTVPCMINTVPY